MPTVSVLRWPRQGRGWPCNLRANRAKFDLSQSCSWFLRVVALRLKIIGLMGSLRAATSPAARQLTGARLPHTHPAGRKIEWLDSVR